MAVVYKRCPVPCDLHRCGLHFLGEIDRCVATGFFRNPFDPLKTAEADKARRVVEVYITGNRGADIKELGSTLGAYGVETAYLCDDKRFVDGQTQALALSIVNILRQFSPKLFLMGSASEAHELGGMVASELGASFVPDCVQIKCDDELNLIGLRPIQRDRALVEVRCKNSDFQIASIREKIYSPMPAAFPDTK